LTFTFYLDGVVNTATLAYIPYWNDV
jgi:hypothetical protein